jgi:hypothetical protein
LLKAEARAAGEDEAGVEGRHGHKSHGHHHHGESEESFVGRLCRLILE